jgi:hypothetical protein
MGHIRPLGFLAYPLNLVDKFILDVRNATGVAVRTETPEKRDQGTQNQGTGF